MEEVQTQNQNTTPKPEDQKPVVPGPVEKLPQQPKVLPKKTVLPKPAPKSKVAPKIPPKPVVEEPKVQPKAGPVLETAPLPQINKKKIVRLVLIGVGVIAALLVIVGFYPLVKNMLMPKEEVKETVEVPPPPLPDVVQPKTGVASLDRLDVSFDKIEGLLNVLTEDAKLEDTLNLKGSNF